MKAIKKLTAAIITLSIALSLVPTFTLTATAAGFTGASGGDGTAESPYEIGTLAQLEAFRNYINDGNTGEGEYFKLTADIDMSVRYHGGNGGELWTPIGNFSKQFKGTLDGGDHKISKLYINTTASYKGLFGYIGKGGKIQNLGVADGFVAGDRFIGGIAGESYGTIENSYYTGAVVGKAYIGGIAG